MIDRVRAVVAAVAVVCLFVFSLCVRVVSGTAA